MGIGRVGIGRVNLGCNVGRSFGFDVGRGAVEKVRFDRSGTTISLAAPS